VCSGAWGALFNSPVAKKLKSSLAVFVAILAAGGCAVTSGQLDAAATFAKSASTLAEGVKSVYAQSAQDEANLRTAKFVVLSRLDHFNPGSIGNRDYETPLIRLSPQEIPGRYAAADALAAYGQALTTLLDSKTQETDLATAAGKLTASLKSVPTKTLKDAHISAADITDIGSLITSLGDLYLDYRREQVLETVVPRAEPVVTRLCNLFARDFDEKSGMFATILTVRLNEIIADTETSLTLNAGDLHSRAILLPIYQQTKTIQLRSTTTFTSLTTAARSCVKTSVAFADSVKDPTLSLNDIIDFATKAQAAYDAVKTTVDQK
jgi:hypothetical protein